MYVAERLKVEAKLTNKARDDDDIIKCKPKTLYIYYDLHWSIFCNIKVIYFSQSENVAQIIAVAIGAIHFKNFIQFFHVIS